MNKFEVLWSQKEQGWNTPLDLYQRLNSVFNFQTDPCTTDDNPLGCKTFFTPETDGLDHKKWSGRVFINPPYQRKYLKLWVAEAIAYTDYSLMLLPARTGNRLWQTQIFPNALMVCFVGYRLKFSNHVDSAPFDSALVLFGSKNEAFKPSFYYTLNNEGYTIRP